MYRIFFALLTIVAIATQLHRQIAGGFSIINFFSFFTIESNIFAAVVCIAGGVGFLLNKWPSACLSFMRGAATLYMATTGIVYVLLLSGLNESLNTTVPWVNAVVHYIMPAAVVIDWYTNLPKTRIPFRWALLWLAYPLAYITYSLIRGFRVHWYPYPFLDVRAHGYSGIMVISGMLAVAMVALVAAIIGPTRHRSVGPRK